ncbi:hypothetical protein [Shinella sp.]|uniref:hypothetical protein n=1 Tax=Shinella sp. TaxID=1870904 RepID=UPI0029B93406|nr:hypothetical protein [Shinella sp.]MDX3977157.1 hypothetical protein [Shinella sp.]
MIGRSVNALEASLIFCFWTGSNKMSEQRRAALSSVVEATHCPVLLLVESTIRSWELETQPYHPAYEYLSETHKADYLRCYFMNYFGGGYTDIKHTTTDWRGAFQQLRESDAVALGYSEDDPEAIAPVGGELEKELRRNYGCLIGNCAYIMKPGTSFTRLWFERVQALLDMKLDLLRAHPARHVRDQAGASFQDGTDSKYPIGWTEMLGDIFHPLAYEYRERIIHAAIAPSFRNYR